MRDSTRPVILCFASLVFEVLDDGCEEDFAFAAEGVDFGGELL